MKKMKKRSIAVTGVLVVGLASAGWEEGATGAFMDRAGTFLEKVVDKAVELEAAKSGATRSETTVIGQNVAIGGGQIGDSQETTNVDVDARDQSITAVDARDQSTTVQDIDVDARDQSTTYDTEIHQ